MKDPLRVPFESTEPDLVGPRLVHEADGDSRRAAPDFCDDLREARLRGGYSLADAARVLRIQEHYLQALEEGRFDQIPGTTYAIGFLRTYAGFLALDPDELIESFKREQGLKSSEQRLAFPSPSDSSPKPRFWLILVVLVLAGLAYGGWQYQSTDGQIATDLVADVSTRLTEAVGLDAADAPEEGAATAAATDADAAAEAVATGASDPAEAVPSEAARASAGEAEPVAAEPVATEGAGAEGVPAGDASVLPASAEVEAAAEPAPAQQAAPAPQVEPAAPAEPVEPAAATAASPPVVSAPLELATVTVGETGSSAGRADEAAGSGTAPTGDPNDAAAAGGDAATVQEPPVEVTVDALPNQPPAATVDAPPDQSAALSVPDEADSWPVEDPGYVPRVYGRSNLDARVVITAVDDSWVQVQGPENELLLTRILHAGDSYRVPDRPGLVMVTGNAGGLEVRVDDAPAPALGPLGVVIRNVALDPDRLLAGTATGR